MKTATRLRAALAALFVLTAMASATPARAPAPVPRAARPDLLGQWRQVHAEFEGLDMTAAERPFLNRWLVRADTITILIKGGQNAGSWRYALRPARSPAEIDLTVTGAGMTYPSIYKLEGDRLTVCIQNFPVRGRPKDFVSRPGSGVGKYVYVRIRPGARD
jgi:uncharacterized protein (TIGR03067 family)